jgi:hypothetical protein
MVNTCFLRASTMRFERPNLKLPIKQHDDTIDNFIDAFMWQAAPIHSILLLFQIEQVQKQLKEQGTYCWGATALGCPNFGIRLLGMSVF